MPTKYNYVAYDPNIGHEHFETFEEAEKFITSHEDEGFSEEQCEGYCWIAKITHTTSFVETDNRENYCQIECEDCKKEECDGEEWGYGSEIDRIGRLELKEKSK